MSTTMKLDKITKQQYIKLMQMQSALAALHKYDEAVGKALLLSMDDPTVDRGAELAKT